MPQSLQHTATYQETTTMPKPRPGWLTCTQVAAKLNIDKSTFWRWRESNRWQLVDHVRILKMGRETFINENDLNAWDAARWGETTDVK